MMLTVFFSPEENFNCLDISTQITLAIVRKCRREEIAVYKKGNDQMDGAKSKLHKLCKRLWIREAVYIMLKNAEKSWKFLFTRSN